MQASEKSICLVLYPDIAVCSEVDRGIARSVSGVFSYRYAQTIEQADEILKTLKVEGRKLGLLVVDSQETYRDLCQVHPGFATYPYGILDTQKDEFYADITNVRKRLRNHVDESNLESWDKAHFLACVHNTLNPGVQPGPVTRNGNSIEPSPLAGLNTDLDKFIDPATLVGEKHKGSPSVATISQLSSAVSEISLRRERRREVQIPLTAEYSSA